MRVLTRRIWCLNTDKNGHKLKSNLIYQVVELTVCCRRLPTGTKENLVQNWIRTIESNFINSEAAIPRRESVLQPANMHKSLSKCMRLDNWECHELQTCKLLHTRTGKTQLARKRRDLTDSENTICTHTCSNTHQDQKLIDLQCF